MTLPPKYIHNLSISLQLHHITIGQAIVISCLDFHLSLLMGLLTFSLMFPYSSFSISKVIFYLILLSPYFFILCLYLDTFQLFENAPDVLAYCICIDLAVI